MQLTVDRERLPVDWKIKTLGEVCNISTGKLNANAAVENGKYPFFTCSREIFTIDHFAFDCEAILLAGNNAVGDFNVKHYTGKFNAYQRTYVITINKGEPLLYKYLYLQVESALKDFKLKSVGTGTKFLKLDMIKNLKLHLPPLSQQKRIVAILDEAFEGIDRAIANTEKNLANSRELFESYLNAIFTKEGEGWIRNKLSEVCEKITDGTHQTPKYFEAGFVFLSSRNVTSGTIDWDKVKYIDHAQHIAMQKRVSPRLHDILLAKNGTTGVAALVDKDIDFDIYVSLALLRPLPVILPRFMLHFVNSPVAKEQFNKRLKGIGVPNLHLKEIKEVDISYPQELALQECIVTKIDEMRNEILRLETIYLQKLAALNELKQSILQKAFTGELTSDTSKTVKEEIAA